VNKAPIGEIPKKRKFQTPKYYETLDFSIWNLGFEFLGFLN
jgi:hypothetical protein